MINKISRTPMPQFKATVQGEKQLRTFTENINNFLNEAKTLPNDDMIKPSFRHTQETPIELTLDYLPGKDSQQKGKKQHIFLADFNGMADFITRAGSELNCFMKMIKKA